MAEYPVNLNRTGTMPKVIGALSELNSLTGVKSIDWHVPDFFSLFRSDKTFYESPSFDFANCSWHLKLHTGTFVRRSLCLMLYNETGGPCPVSFTFSIKGTDGMLNWTNEIVDVSLEDNREIPEFFSMFLIDQSENDIKSSACLTIVCYLKLNCSGIVSPAKGEVDKQIKSRDRHMIWCIRHFFSEFRSLKLFYESPSFHCANASWCLQLYPGFDSSGSLFLFLYNKTKDQFSGVCAFSIRDGCDTIIGTKVFVQIIIDERGVTEYLRCSFFDQKEICLLSTDAFTIVCDLKVNLREERRDTFNTNRKGNSAIITTLTDTLSKNLWSLFASEDSWDTVLKVHGKEFKVHKAILIARSSVFATIFRDETSQKQTGTIDIHECHGDTFYKFLEFLYSGKVGEISFTDAFHLYHTAEKFETRELKKICSKYIGQNLALENFFNCVLLAEKFNDVKLFSAVQKFFNKNLHDVLMTNDWKIFVQNHLHLSNKLLIEMSKSISIVSE